MSAVFTMSCWNSTSNPATVNKAKILAQAFTLVKALAGTLSDGQIALPSRDKIESKKGIEIMVWHRYNPGTSFFDNVKNFLNKKANDLKLDYKNFVLESESLTRSFSKEEQANIYAFNKSVSASPTESDIQNLMDLAKKSSPGTEDTKNVPGNQLYEPFQITTKRLERLRNATGDKLKDEIIGIMDNLNAIVSSTKTAWATILMIAGGIITIGTWITYIAGGLEVLLTSIAVMSLLGAIIGMAPIIALLAAAVVILGALVGGLYLAFKDTMNILLVMNRTGHDIQFRKDQVVNGERSAIVGYLPAQRTGDDLVWAGFYIYRKWSIGPLSLGFYGSEFGASFTRYGADFSVGMDCPNSAFGGTNSIRTCLGLQPDKAAQLANDSGSSDDAITLPNGKTHVRRANTWGNINWGWCIND